MAKSIAEKLKQVDNLTKQANALREALLPVNQTELFQQTRLVDDLEDTVRVRQESLDMASEELSKERGRLDTMRALEAAVTERRQQAASLEKQAKDLEIEISLAESGSK